MLQVTLSQEDYTMIMRVLAENLGESLPEKSVPTPVSQVRPVKRTGSKASLYTLETKQTPSKLFIIDCNKNHMTLRK